MGVQFIVTSFWNCWNCHRRSSQMLSNILPKRQTNAIIHFFFLSFDSHLICRQRDSRVYWSPKILTTRCPHFMVKRWEHWTKCQKRLPIVFIPKKSSPNVPESWPQYVLYLLPSSSSNEWYFHIIFQNTDVTDIEKQINCGQIEEVIVQAENELLLARKMLGWKPWEPLAREAPATQWNWPPAKITAPTVWASGNIASTRNVSVSDFPVRKINAKTKKKS